MLAAVARIVVVPFPAPVTGTLALVLFAAIMTDAGTVATAGFVELRLTGKPPAGAGPESVSIRFCVAVPAIVRFCGEKLSDAVTCTDWVAEPKPGADAVMVAGPTPTPLIRGWVAGAFDPAGILTFVTESVARDALLVVRDTVTPPAGAFAESAICTGVDWPRPIVEPVGMTMDP